MQIMTLVSYIFFVHDARMKRAAVKQAHHGQLPNLLPGEALTGRLPVRSASIPVATVVQPAGGGQPSVAASAAQVFMPPLGILNDAETAVVVDVDASQPEIGDRDRVDCDTVATGVAMLQPHACMSTDAVAGAVAESVDRGEASGRGGMDVARDSTHARYASRTSLEDSAEAAAESALKARGKCGAVVWGLWDSVREDPRTGFR